MSGSGRDLVASFDAMEQHVAAALPAHVPFAFFRRVVLTAIQASPDLMRADRRSLLTASLRLAGTGLVPDGREAALVVFKGQVQPMPMVQGLVKLARQSGEVTGIHAQIVYAGEPFRILVRDGWPSIEHEIVPTAIDGGKQMLAYAVAILRDGTRQPAWMTWAQVMKVKAVSRSGNNGPWGSWPDEMAKKTVIRRLAKMLPLDRERDADRRLADAIEAADDDHERLPGAGTVATPAGMIGDDGGRLDHLEAQIDTREPAMAENATEEELRDLMRDEERDRG